MLLHHICKYLHEKSMIFLYLHTYFKFITIKIYSANKHACLRLSYDAQWGWNVLWSRIYFVQLPLKEMFLMSANLFKGCENEKLILLLRIYTDLYGLSCFLFYFILKLIVLMKKRYEYDFSTLGPSINNSDVEQETLFIDCSLLINLGKF